MENIDDVQTALWTPNDGWADPTGTTNALAKGARQLGAQVIRNNRVTDMNALPDGRWEVITEQGRIVCEHVVNAAGHYAPQVGAMVGLDVPIVSVIHQYLITELLDAMKALDWEIPVTRTARRRTTAARSTASSSARTRPPARRPMASTASTGTSTST